MQHDPATESFDDTTGNLAMMNAIVIQDHMDEHALKIPPEGQEGPWLDYWLIGATNGLMESSPVVYYMMGAFDEPNAPGHVWRRTDGWPIFCEPTPFHLYANGSLRTDHPLPNVSH